MTRAESAMRCRYSQGSACAATHHGAVNSASRKTPPESFTTRNRSDRASVIMTYMADRSGFPVYRSFPARLQRLTVRALHSLSDIQRRQAMKDATGYELSGASAASVDALEQGLHEFRCYIGDPVATVDRALA